ncbi:MAG: Segregation and condensation protein B [Firmicutes bacterium ADurb.Bin506]|jgi:segregation and condensation protein B|nr:MAG: Segregation and condensation protein B [Firmicutes bacterium ADurb.Bin506]
MQMLSPKSAQAAIEAILFAAAFPVHIDDLAYAIEADAESVRRLLREIEDRFSRPESGAMLACVDGCYLLLSRPEYSGFVERLSRRQKPAVLSPASMETLAIIAYRQPVTRGEIEKIRGVNSDSAISTLIERGLVAEAGRRNSIGRPVLYATTPEFLLHLGLRSLDQLPPLPETENEPAANPDAEEPSSAGAETQEPSLPGLG